MSLKRLHVGMTVVRTGTDLFYYLRNWTRIHSDNEEYLALPLPVELLDITSKVEYSWRWMFRPLYYNGIIFWLERALLELKAKSAQYSSIVLYLPDDGYWAELIADLQKRCDTHLSVFNVQHGLPLLHPITARQKKWRRIVNSILRATIGVPGFGFGFGSGRLSGYIVISPMERQYVVSNFGTPSYVMPQFSRGEFFEALAGHEHQSNPNGKMRLLLAFGPIFARGINVFGNVDRQNLVFLRDITACLHAIKREIDCDIIFRFHPGQDRQKAEAEFHKAGLDCVARIDSNRAVLDSLRKCDFVVSYASTVLIEGWLIGIVPVSFSPVDNRPPPTTVPHELIEFSRDISGTPIIATTRGSLFNLFSRQTIAEYRKRIEPPDYDMELPWLQ